MNPWAVEAGDDGVDYGKLIRAFGSTPMSQVGCDRLVVDV